MLVTVILAVGACSSTPSGGSGTPDPTIAFCQALDASGLKLAALDGLTPAATVCECKQAVDDATAALAALVAVSGPFVGAQLDEAQMAQTNLQAADQLPADASPAQAEDALQPLPEALIQEVGGTRNAICNTRPTPSA
jgi:hypothetical protein